MVLILICKRLKKTPDQEDWPGVFKPRRSVEEENLTEMLREHLFDLGPVSRVGLVLWIADHGKEFIFGHGAVYRG